MEKIVYSAAGVTIVGAGTTLKRHLGFAVRLAPFIMAADGGAASVSRSGLVPDAIVGDMDSIQPDFGTAYNVPVYRISEQTSTDFEKCLYALDARFAVALGVTGSRFDHSLAAMNALARHRNFPVLILSGDDVIFHCPKALDICLPVGTRVSLFPMAPISGTSSGLAWPIDGLEFSPSSRIGTSNQSNASAISLRFDGCGMLVILPWRHAPAVLSALKVAV